MAHIILTEPDENETAVDPPTRWKVFVSVAGPADVVAGAAVVAAAVVTVDVAGAAVVVVVDRLVVGGVAGAVTAEVPCVDWVAVVVLEADALRVVDVVEDPLFDPEASAAAIVALVVVVAMVVDAPFVGATDASPDDDCGRSSRPVDAVPVERLASAVGSFASPSSCP